MVGRQYWRKDGVLRGECGRNKNEVNGRWCSRVGVMGGFRDDLIQGVGVGERD